MILVYKLVIVCFKLLSIILSILGGILRINAPPPNFGGSVNLDHNSEDSQTKAKPSLVDYGLSSEK